jgi:CheY-like chemotaxis protein
MDNDLVLVVDDDEGVLRLLKILISSGGYSVITATDGAAAVKQLEQFHPSLVLTDIRMPVMDGIKLIRHIRRTPGLMNIPVVAMSGAGNEGLIDAMAAGATSTVGKPLDFDKLVEMVGEYVSPRKSGPDRG